MKNTVFKPHKSSLGMNANILAMMIYIAPFFISLIPYVGYAAWILPLVIFIVEKKSKFVKFHAMTALIIMIIAAVVGIVLMIIIWSMSPFYSFGFFYYGFGGGIVGLLMAILLIFSLSLLVLDIFLCIKAYSYKIVGLPIVGRIAANASGITERTTRTRKKKR
ncbi:MAG: DUF4870 domain-containing protein [Treponema sp.]|nr:DUF4870 domain-containing protein [Treponema sp.]